MEAVEETAEEVIESARAIAEGNELTREEHTVLLDNMLDKALQDKYYFVEENMDVLESKEFEKKVFPLQEEEVQETEEDEVEEVQEVEETEEEVVQEVEEEEVEEEEEKEPNKTFKSLDDLLQERIQ